MKQLATEDILREYRDVVESQEKNSFHHRASLSQNHSRKSPEEEDYRLPYQRDVNRIIHSKAYSRYSDKTQVVYLVDNDHITHRALHVQLVSSFARGIAEILRLNADLVEACALGHDVGHPPFGHEGETYLSALSEEYGNGSFTHSLQSCRLLSEIEPLNLGLAVYDGFLCHDGGLCGNQLKPSFGKTWVDHEQDKKQKQANPEGNLWPATLEGCLVKICDTVSYLGRDIEDAINLGILNRKQVPHTILGVTNRDILNVVAKDIIQMSYGNDYISLSPEVYEAIKGLRKFNFEQIYTHPKLKVESIKIKRSYRILFELLLDDLDKQKTNSHTWKDFLGNKEEEYLLNSSLVQQVIDYVACMTDGYFIKTLQQLAVPLKIKL